MWRCSSCCCRNRWGKKAGTDKTWYVRPFRRNVKRTSRTVKTIQDSRNCRNHYQSSWHCSRLCKKRTWLRKKQSLWNRNFIRHRKINSDIKRRIRCGKTFYSGIFLRRTRRFLYDSILISNNRGTSIRCLWYF